MTTKKTRSTKQNKVEKYNIQIPVALDKTQQLEELAKEMDLSLAQYCRCVLLQHLKDNKGISNNNQVVVKEQITTENPSNTGEQPAEKTIDPVVEEVKKTKTRGFGAK